MIYIFEVSPEKSLFAVLENGKWLTSNEQKVTDNCKVRSSDSEL